MSSKLFKLNSKDFYKGLLVAVLATVFTWGASALNAPGFDLATLDWGEVLRIAFAAGMAYIGKNFISDEEGNPLGFRKTS